jgi:hypothetical protein
MYLRNFPWPPVAPRKRRENPSPFTRHDARFTSSATCNAAEVERDDLNASDLASATRG